MTGENHRTRKQEYETVRVLDHGATAFTHICFFNLLLGMFLFTVLLIVPLIELKVTEGQIIIFGFAYAFYLLGYGLYACYHGNKLYNMSNRVDGEVNGHHYL